MFVHENDFPAVECHRRHDCHGSPYSIGRCMDDDVFSC
jgi:hypothetical protein